MLIRLVSKIQVASSRWWPRSNRIRELSAAKFLKDFDRRERKGCKENPVTRRAMANDQWQTTNDCSPQVHYQQSRFGHVFDCVAQAFAAETRIFHTAVRHVIDAEAGDIAGDDAANLQFLECLKNPCSIACENSGLQSVRRLVDLAKRLREIVIRLESDYGRENLLAIHFHVSAGPGQHRWLHNRTSPFPSGQQRRTILHRFLHPLSGTYGITFANERAEVGGVVHRIADLQLTHSRKEQVSKFGNRRTLDQNALHRNAGLAGIAEAARNAALRSPGDIGVAVDDYSGTASKLEHNLLLAGAALDLPANGSAAGEAGQLDATVGHEQPGGDCKREDPALDFYASGLQWLAGFLREGAGEFFFPRSDVLGNRPQYTLTLKRRQPACAAKSPDGTLDCALGMFPRALKNLRER